MRKIEIGDWIQFQSPTRCSNRTVWRKVRSLSHMGFPEVGYSGWADFVVRPSEIKQVRKTKP